MMTEVYIVGHNSVFYIPTDELADIEYLVPGDHVDIKFGDNTFDCVIMRPWRQVIIGNSDKPVGEVTVRTSDTCISRQSTYQHDTAGSFTYNEALVSIVALLSTPIARRKNDQDINKCVDIVQKHLCQQGLWPIR